jgi:hypothetical protein
MRDTPVRSARPTIRPPIPAWRWAVGGFLAAALAMYGAQQWSTASYLAGQTRGILYQQCVAETQDKVECQRRYPLVEAAYAR